MLTVVLGISAHWSDMTPDVQDDVAQYRMESQVCVYVMHFHTSKGLLRSNRLRSELDSQGIPYNTVSSGLVDAKNWPVKCLRSYGYAGNWMSLWKVWTRATRSCKAEWVIIFESDAAIPPNFLQTFSKARAKNISAKAIWMDERSGFKHSPHGCCTVATAWHRSTWSQMIADLDPNGISAWHQNYSHRPNNSGCATHDRPCLTDFYLCNVVMGRRIPALSFGVVKHPKSNHTDMNWAGAKLG